MNMGLGVRAELECPQGFLLPVISRPHLWFEMWGQGQDRAKKGYSQGGLAFLAASPEAKCRQASLCLPGSGHFGPPLPWSGLQAPEQQFLL